MRKKLRILDLTYIALLSAALAVCAWITIPTPVVVFTMQTFGVFLALILLGGKRGALSILVYVLLGAAGLPVFSGFRGGFGILFGPTGGYIWGFLFTALLYWAITARLGERLPVQVFALLLGLFLCYALGTGWYMLLMSMGKEGISLTTALLGCVVPFILPDLGKLALAVFLGRRLHPFLK